MRRASKTDDFSNPVPLTQVFNRDVNGKAALTVAYLSTAAMVLTGAKEARAAPLSAFYLQNFVKMYGTFPLKSDEVVVGIITKETIGLGLKEITDGAKGNSKRVIINSVKADGDDSIRNNAKKGMIIVALLTPTVPHPSPRGTNSINSNYINVEGLTLQQVYEAIQSVKSRPFSIVFRDTDEFFNQIELPVDKSTTPLTVTTTLVPTSLSKVGEQVLSVNRSTPTSLKSRITTGDTLPQANKGDVIEIRYRTHYEKPQLISDAATPLPPLSDTTDPLGGCIFFLLGSEKSGNSKYFTFDSETSVSTNKQSSVAVAETSLASSPGSSSMSPGGSSSPTLAAAVAFLSNNLPPAWDLLLQGMAVGEKRTVSMPPSFYTQPAGDDNLVMDIELVSINGTTITK